MFLRGKTPDFHPLSTKNGNADFGCSYLLFSSFISIKVRVSFTIAIAGIKYPGYMCSLIIMIYQFHNGLDMESDFLSAPIDNIV